MEINQQLNHTKTGTDFPNFAAKKPASAPDEERPSRPVANLGASAVNLSEEGRTASRAFDFNAASDNLARMEALAAPESFAKAHAAISYETVRDLLN